MSRLALTIGHNTPSAHRVIAGRCMSTNPMPRIGMAISVTACSRNASRTTRHTAQLLAFPKFCYTRVRVQNRS